MSIEAGYAKAQELEIQGKHGEASSLYKEIIKQSQDARVFIAYGACLQHLGHWQESAKQLMRGIDLKPHYCEGDARLMLAEALLRLGLKGRAIEQWRLVAAMEPTYPSYDAVPNEALKKLREHGS